MAQNEKFNKYNYGADDYSPTKSNHHYNEKDYKLKRYKAKDSGIIRENDENGRIIDYKSDIGRHHHKHYHTEDLSSDRLFLNKIDNNDDFINDYTDKETFEQPDNITPQDIQNRKVRVLKLVERDDFHERLDNFGRRRR